MKLLVDMNLSPLWVAFLGESGIEAKHWSSIRSCNAPDIEIMSYARVHGSVVLTQDLDFSAMLAITQGQKPSVVQIRSDNVGVDFIGMKTLLALRQMELELENGALITVDPRRTGLSILPLRSAQ